jgi:hypothetical protein
MDTLIGLEDAVAASKRTIHEHEFKGEVKVLGVDVARFGDDETCIVLRQGKAVYQPKALRTMDLMQVAATSPWRSTSTTRTPSSSTRQAWAVASSTACASSATTSSAWTTQEAPWGKPM